MAHELYGTCAETLTVPGCNPWLGLLPDSLGKSLKLYRPLLDSLWNGVRLRKLHEDKT